MDEWKIQTPIIDQSIQDQIMRKYTPFIEPTPDNQIKNFYQKWIKPNIIIIILVTLIIIFLLYRYWNTRKNNVTRISKDDNSELTQLLIDMYTEQNNQSSESKI
jgi:cytochrome c-type biogenesis protein CcmH/NrfF